MSKLHPLGNGRMIGEDGKKYISAREAEAEYGHPRELLAMWSDQPIPVPPGKKNRRIRRHVVLKALAKHAGVYMPMFSVDGGVLFAEQLFKCLSAASHRARKLDALGAQLWMCLFELALPDNAPTSRDTANMLEVVLPTLSQDFHSPVTPKDIEREWDSFEASGLA